MRITKPAVAGAPMISLFCLSLGISTGFAGQRIQAPAELLPLITPDLSEMKDPIRRGIEGILEIVRELSRQETIQPEALGQAYGRLGEVYQAHHFQDAARVAYLNAASLVPNQERWSYYLGFIYLDKGDLERAAASFARVLERTPKDYFALIRHGNVLLDLSLTEKAGEQFQRALEIEPNSAFANYGMGQVAVGRKQFAEAVVYFEKALADQPEASTIRYPLGLAYRRIGNREKARHYLQNRGEGKIRVADPRLNELGKIVTTSTLHVVLDQAKHAADFSPLEYEHYILRKLGDKSGAVDYLAAALAEKKNARRDPDRGELARIHYGIGCLYEFHNREQDAAREYRAAVSLAPTLLDGYIKLGKIHARAGRFEEELAQYKKVLDREPYHAQALLVRASALAERGRFEEARTGLETLLKKHPRHEKGTIRLARVLQLQGNLNLAAVYYERALTLELEEKERSTCWSSLAALLPQTGRFDEAVGYYQQLLELAPDSHESRLGLAGLLAYMDRNQEADHHYEAVIRHQPENENARLGQIANLIVVQRFERAKNLLEDGVSSMPDSLSLTHLLARFLAVVPELTLRDGPRALELAKRVLQRSESLSHGETLAMALALNGRFEEAVELQQSLVTAAEKAHAGQILPRLHDNLNLYNARQSCCRQVDPDVLLPPRSTP